jgi:broad specificity phosphatase PhoE
LEPRLRERNVGSWSGLSRAEIESEWPDDMARVRAGDRDVRPGGGESSRELEARVHRALDDLRERFAGGRIALVTHRGVTNLLSPGSALANAETCWVPAETRELA